MKVAGQKKRPAVEVAILAASLMEGLSVYKEHLKIHDQ